ncbi:hypothetical protein D3C80_1482910 [compost metagenome]
MVEHRARRQLGAVRHAKALELRGLAFHADLHRAQTHRLALLDVQTQQRLASRLQHFATDLRLVVAECLQRPARLALGVAGEALQALEVAITQLADVRLDVLAQGLAFGRQQDLQLGRSGSRDTGQQGEQQG